MKTTADWLTKVVQGNSPPRPPKKREPPAPESSREPPPEMTAEQTKVLSAFVGGVVLGIFTAVLVVACAVIGEPVHKDGPDLIR